MKKEKKTKNYDCYFCAMPTEEGVLNFYVEAKTPEESSLELGKLSVLVHPIKYKKNNYIMVKSRDHDADYYKFMVSVIKKKLTDKKIETYRILANQITFIKNIYESKHTYVIDDLLDSTMHILVDIPNILLISFYNDVWDITNSIIKAINKKYKVCDSTQFFIMRMVLCAYAYEVKNHPLNLQSESNKITYVRIENERNENDIRIYLLSEILFYLMYKKNEGNEIYKKRMKAYLKTVSFDSETLFSEKTTKEMLHDMRTRARNYQIEKEFEADKYALEGKVDTETY